VNLRAGKRRDNTRPTRALTGRNMDGDLFLGIDFGTSGARATLIDSKSSIRVDSLESFRHRK